MIEEHAELVDSRRRRTDFLLSPRDVFAILATAGVGAKRAGDKCERMRHAVGRHLSERVGEQRVPIAVAPVDWQPQPVCLQFRR